jgi:ribosomal protein S18 acetylase RimI-like enzyme
MLIPSKIAIRHIAKAIDLDKHAAICVEFRRDSFVASYGNADQFYAESGNNGEHYLSWLRPRIEKFPEGQVHVWDGDEIVGQMEMLPNAAMPEVLYVNLFYVKADRRGTHVANFLQNYFLDLSKRNGCSVGRLSVSPTNDRAISFYKKHGWIDVGCNPTNPKLRLMEFTSL